MRRRTNGSSTSSACTAAHWPPSRSRGRSVRWKDLPSRRLAVFAIVTSVTGLLLALGRYGLVYEWFTVLPLVGKFRAPARHIMLVHLGLAVLVAILFEDLRRLSHPIGCLRRQSWLWMPLLISVGVAAFAWWRPQIWTTFPDQPLYAGGMVIGVMLLAFVTTPRQAMRSGFAFRVDVAALFWRSTWASGAIRMFSREGCTPSTSSPSLPDPPTLSRDPPCTRRPAIGTERSGSSRSQSAASVCRIAPARRLHASQTANCVFLARSGRRRRQAGRASPIRCRVCDSCPNGKWSTTRASLPASTFGRLRSSRRIRMRRQGSSDRRAGHRRTRTPARRCLDTQPGTARDDRSIRSGMAGDRPFRRAKLQTLPVYGDYLGVVVEPGDYRCRSPSSRRACELASTHRSWGWSSSHSSVVTCHRGSDESTRTRFYNALPVH